jgi:hypothetical protein
MGSAGYSVGGEVPAKRPPFCPSFPSFRSKAEVGALYSVARRLATRQLMKDLVPPDSLKCHGYSWHDSLSGKDGEICRDVRARENRLG